MWSRNTGMCRHANMPSRESNDSNRRADPGTIVRARGCRGGCGASPGPAWRARCLPEVRPLCGDGAMVSEVTVVEVAAQRTVVIAAATTWQEFPTLWRQLSDEVWAC